MPWQSWIRRKRQVISACCSIRHAVLATRFSPSYWRVSLVAEEEQYLGSQKPQKLNQGNRKTIRGKVNGVRRAKELLMRDVVVQSSGTVSKFYEKEKDGTIVVYTTSVSVVRGTHQLCQDISKVWMIVNLSCFGVLTLFSGDF